MAVDIENNNLVEKQGFYSSVTMATGDTLYVQPLLGNALFGNLFGTVWGVIAASDVSVEWTLAAVPGADDWFDHIDSPVRGTGRGLPLTFNGVEFYRIMATADTRVTVKSKTKHALTETI